MAELQIYGVCMGVEVYMHAWADRPEGLISKQQGRD